MTIDQANKIWARLSARYAENAQGDVTVWAYNPNPRSIWNTVERPALERNPNVTRITVVHPALSLKETSNGSVRELGNQEAQHDSGMILRSVNRDTMQLEYEGRTLTLGVGRLVDGDLYYLPATLVWDDGSPVSPDIARQIKPVITEVENFWDMTPDFETLNG